MPKGANLVDKTQMWQAAVPRPRVDRQEARVNCYTFKDGIGQDSRPGPRNFASYTRGSGNGVMPWLGARFISNIISLVTTSATDQSGQAEAGLIQRLLFLPVSKAQ